jgi:NAD(P)-dependent dehydrogenase (short-subunit alcohol dehydrogenase family)
MIIDLTGQSALITGAGGGIGRQLALDLADAGADVVLLGRHAPTLDETAQLVRAAGGRASLVVCDVTDAAQVTAAAAAASSSGPVSILVNNAGGARFIAPMIDLQPAGWDKVFALNVRAPFLMAKALVPQMIECGGGAIVNIGSVVGEAGHEGLAHYSTAKAALVTLTKNMAREWGPHGIRANIVIPGVIETDAWDSFDASTMSSIKDLPLALARKGRPADVGPSVAFLASRLASHITGTCLVVDGGSLA